MAIGFRRSDIIGPITKSIMDVNVRIRISNLILNILSLQSIRVSYMV
jgi:hypothetical protein